MDRPTLRQLEYAVAVDDLRSFSKAAAAQHVSQPGLSAQIAELERRLGVVLFERNRTATTPTPAGQEVLTRARAVLRDIDDLVRSASVHQDTVAGVLRVAAIPTIAPYLLSTAAQQMRRLWPDAQLELGEMRTADLVAAVAEARVDIGFLATPVDTGSLDVAEVAFEPFVVAVSETHPLARRRSIRATDLADLEILLLEDGHCLRDHALAVCSLAGNALHRDVHHTSLPVLAQMVAASGAATFLPASAVPVEARPGSGLTAIPLADRHSGRTLSLVWRPGDPRASLYRRALDHLIPALTRSVDVSSTARP